jgi:hypothetical protein
MTVNAVRRSRRRTSEPRPVRISAPPESLAIGEINQTVFDCPACARPLAVGARRCPGCRTHLVLGIQLAKASVFAASGLAIGVAFGAALGFGIAISRSAATPAQAAAAISSALPEVSTGGQHAGTTPQPQATAGIGSEIPPISRSALDQSLGVNDRLAADAVALHDSLLARVFDAPTVAQTLRTISADSVFGQQLAGRLDDWSGSADLGRKLTVLYDAVHQTAIEALVASVRDEAAYRAASVAMIRVLDGLPALDAEARTLAAQVGLAVTPSTAR